MSFLNLLAPRLAEEGKQVAVWESGAQPRLTHHSQARDSLHLAGLPCTWKEAVTVVANVQNKLIP